MAYRRAASEAYELIEAFSQNRGRPGAAGLSDVDHPRFRRPIAIPAAERPLTDRGL